MPALAKYYPAKVILYGEYTVLMGSSVCAVPFDYYGLRWLLDPCHHAYPFAFSEMLKAWHKLANHLDLAKMEQDYIEGWRLMGDIPIGCGLGSSGACIAAFYDAYHKEQLEGQALLCLLAQMENFFHAHSSGTDPYISHSQQAYCIDQGVFHQVSFDLQQHVFQLIDSSMPRATKNLMTFFQAIQNDTLFLNDYQNDYLPALKTALTSLSEGDDTQLLTATKTIAKFQWKWFQAMICSAIRPYWERAMQSDDWAIKLCGAGGGGYYLATGTLPKIDLPVTRIL